MIYKFRRDWKVITISVLSILSLWGVFFYIALFGNAPVGGVIAIGAIFLLVTATGLRTPRYVYVEKEQIIIKFYLGSKVLSDIASVHSITMRELAHSIRLMGNGGFFGYTGWYFKRMFGFYYMSAVNLDELALVTLINGKQYVINYPHELLESNKGTSDKYKPV